MDRELEPTGAGNWMPDVILIIVILKLTGA